MHVIKLQLQSRGCEFIPTFGAQSITLPAFPEPSLLHFVGFIVARPDTCAMVRHHIVI